MVAAPRQFVFLAGTGFDSIVSGRTRRLAEVLARRGHEVVFVELPSVRFVMVPPFRFGPRPAAAGGIRIIRLCPLPGYVRLSGTLLARRWDGYAVRRLLTWIPNLAESVVVVPTPRWVPVLASLPAQVRCYDYIDHIRVQAGPRGAEVFNDWDDALLRMSDVVTTVAEPLREHLVTRVDADRVFMVPNGVPSEWVDASFEAVSRESLGVGPDRPIAGFLGSLYEWIDLDLLAGAARALPEVEFILVGPTRRSVRLDTLEGIPNLRRLGPVPFSEVPRLIKAFDVCLIPFRRDVIAECANPLKVYEYCALGKPVVSTVGYDAGGKPSPITVAPTAAEFAAAVGRAAREDTPQEQARRIAFAREHTWERRGEDFIAAVESACARRSVS
jgi:glycosyltransferase involved in cell wall biosynthesis